MSEKAIILVLVSATIHMTWNLYAKNSGDPVAFLVKALFYSMLVYAPLFVFMQFRVHYPATMVWCLLGSGLSAGFYFFCLGKAYSHGQVSIAYPIARAFPILVLAYAGLFLSEVPTIRGAIGIILVVLGCFILPWQRFRLGPEGFCLANYRNRSMLWAVLAAIGTATYSILDKIAAASMPIGHEWDWLDKVNYVYLQNALSWLATLLLIRIGKYEITPVSKRLAMISGILFLLSYSLILVALATDPVAYVVSFRQLSVVMAAIISMLWLERNFSRPRLVGALAIFAGTILVGLG